MKWFLYLISLTWIAAGVWGILYTARCKQLVLKMMGFNRKGLSVVAVLIGVLLLLSASQSRHLWFLVILGLLTVGKGVFFMFVKDTHYEKIKNWYLNSASDQTYRFFGILLLIFGTALLSWIV